jgi:c-di-GMP-binding flagellar brake protein YcgR
MINRRKSDRISVDRSVQIKLSDDKVVHARMINISEGGLAIRYGASAQVGAVLQLQFTIPADDIITDITTKAKVTHHHFTQYGYYIGMEFVELSEESSDAIRTFIRSKASSMRRRLY